MNVSRRFPAPRALAAVLALMLVALAPRLAHADVPGRVGRISFMSGDVQAYSETEPDWKVAYVNEPITSRNSIFVGDSGRAEISIGSTTLAMDAGSQVDIQQLDDNTFNANVVRGRVSLRVRRIDQGDQYNVAVPGADFALLRPGRYRVDALDSGSGITVFEGQASVQSDRAPVTVNAGNAMRVVAGQDPDGPAQLLSAAPIPATLDDWVLAREARFRNSQAERYVSPNMTGYEDLDANGRWATEADVGPVWYPTTYVNADWAPYRHGRWAYVAPWGYTWVDDAPWGFAPFHYGRWLQVGGRWGWCPGEYVVRPAYAPALVGFYGGAGFNASFSVGVGPAVGWYPLAPWQRFNPGYAHNSTYINQVNNITIVNAPARFAGRGPDGWNRERGSTIAPQQAFASQRSITNVAIAAPRDFVERGGPVNMNALPRPVAVSGATRRGPEAGVGNARPEFRSPREFASRAQQPGERRDDAERGGRPNVNDGGRPEGGRPFDRSPQPPTGRRVDDAPRPGVTTETARPQFNQGPAPAVERGGDRGVDRPNLQQRLPSQPAFNRERPVPQATPNLPAPAVDNGDPARFTPRAQPTARTGDDSANDRRQPINDRTNERQNERAFERPRGEVRTMPAPSAPQFQQPAPAIERPRPEMRSVPAPVAQPVQQPQRIERPAPPVQQPQRIERPAQPAPQVQAPVQQAPAAQPARPQRAERPEPNERGGPPGMGRDR